MQNFVWNASQRFCLDQSCEQRKYEKKPHKHFFSLSLFLSLQMHIFQKLQRPIFWLMVLAGWREASKWRHRNLRRAHYSHFKNLFLIDLTHFIWVFRNIRTHAIGSISFVHKLRITVVVGVVDFVVGVVSIIFMTTFLTTFVHTFKSVHELKNKDFLKGAFRLVASCCRIAVDCVNAGKENLLLA